MRSLPDAEMGDLVPHAGVNSDKTTDQRKQIERQLEEDEGAEYYVHLPPILSHCRILKLLLRIMLHQEEGEFLPDRIICILKWISILESKDSLESPCVGSLSVDLTISNLG